VIESLMRSWRAMAPRERRMILVATVVVLCALIWLVAFEPASNGRTRLLAELPKSREQLARLNALAQEARDLSAAPRSADSPQALRGAVESSIRRAGLEAQLTQLTLSGELIDLRFSAVDYAQWLGWLDGMLRETRLRVADVALSRESSAGVVGVRLVLELPGRESR
jgi:general secretion pathway protein M